MVLAATVAATASTAAPGDPAAKGGKGQERSQVNDLRADITYTAGGVPHIRATSFRGVGYGYGYAVAKDNLCLLADGYVTVNGERSKYLGPSASPGGSFGTASTNLSSDLLFTQIKDSGVVEELIAQPAPLGPRTEVRQIIEGYAAGYNAWVRESGRTACETGVPVRPIEPIDVYRNMYALAVVAGTGQWADAIAFATPPAAAPSGARASTQRSTAAAEPTLGEEDIADLERELLERTTSIEMGSNAIAVGKEATTDGASVLLGNPHYPWQGNRRFYQAHMTVPGRMDVSGGSLMGIPLVQIGFNTDVAWSHTVSTPRTFGLRALTLVPGDPTAYIVDGEVERMTSRDVSVEVRQPDGSLATVTRTLYSTRYGPVLAGGLGLPIAWTATTAHALQDANADNVRGLNTWFGYGQAESVDDLRRVADETLGIPWVNTIATDAAGNAMFADIQVVPAVTNELVAACGTPVGKAVFPTTRIPILDGSRSECAWLTDDDALVPGLFGPKRMPVLIRSDHAFNANDSAWVSHVEERITGYPLIFGDIATERSLRTRMTAAAVQERTEGTDGLPGRGFSTELMEEVFDKDESMAARVAQAAAVEMCRDFPDGLAPTSSGAAVPVGDACDVLESWDGTFQVDAQGALLFDRFWRRTSSAGPALWLTPFDATRPIDTPRDLNVANPAVQRAFGDAVAEVSALGLDDAWGERHYVVRNGERIPIHGAAHGNGVLNVITATWTPGQGYTEVTHGSSYVQIVGLGGRCPDASTLVTYSQSTDPSSPHYADQTRLFSQSEFVDSPFCVQDVRKAATSTVRVSERP
jgi:acyl-homoserine-lactone acylase